MVESIRSNQTASVDVFSLRDGLESYLRDTPRRGRHFGRCRADSRGSHTEAPRGASSSTPDDVPRPVRHYGERGSAIPPLSACRTQ